MADIGVGKRAHQLSDGLGLRTPRMRATATSTWNRSVSVRSRMESRRSNTADHDTAIKSVESTPLIVAFT